MHFDVHEHAVADLVRLWETDPAAASVIAVTLEQLQADPRLIDKLTQFGDNDVGAVVVNVKRWHKASSRTRRIGDLWRLRILDTPATSLRIVYGYQYQTRQVCVLAVVHKRDFSYELSGEIAERILSDWRAF